MMMSSNLLHSFPTFELCYEITAHKKVLMDDDEAVLLAIPEGQKGFAWFTMHNDEKACFFLDMDKNKPPNKLANKLLTSFTEAMVGTIFYGTAFTDNHRQMHYFCVEDIYFHNYTYCAHWPFGDKMTLWKRLFQDELSPFALDTGFTIFGLPLMASTEKLLLRDLLLLPYTVCEIKYRFLSRKNAKKIVVQKYDKGGYKPSQPAAVTKQYTVPFSKPTSGPLSKKTSVFNNGSPLSKKTSVFNNGSPLSKKTSVFKVMADLEPDIYCLYAPPSSPHAGNKEEFVGFACIPDYKTSVMMNRLFRNIKENANLDALEESDDEEEFEDQRADKFVYLDRAYLMHCTYHYKFKKWCPVRLADETQYFTAATPPKQ